MATNLTPLCPDEGAYVSGAAIDINGGPRSAGEAMPGPEPRLLHGV